VGEPVLERFKPRFWDNRFADSGPFKRLFNFRRIWKLAVLLTSLVAIIPLFVLAIFDLNVTRHSAETQINLRITKLVSNTDRTLTFFLEERKYALDFIVNSHSYKTLSKPQKLAGILESLKQTMGGFVDLGVIDATGEQVCYVGPYTLQGKNYSGEAWFQEVLERGLYISDVFLGFREAPHLVIAIKHENPDGSFYIFRATLDTDRFNQVLSQIELIGQGDMFLINRQGVIQTPSTYHGNVLNILDIQVPKYSDYAQVFNKKNGRGQSLIVGYSYIKGTPFILMNITRKNELMRPVYKINLLLVGFIAVSTTLILLVVMGVATRLVNEIYNADQQRVRTLREVEHSSKLASIGRLAAGVAHEINNPLAIIGEKAGLMKDIMMVEKGYPYQGKLMGLVDSILASVERCGAITKRLLGFAKHLEVKIEPVDLATVIRDVLAFLNREASYRSITVTTDLPEDLPFFESDHGKLQQIFLNLVNNAFAAMSNGGTLEIRARQKPDKDIVVTVRDDGCGIPEADMERIFEPFFSTKKEKGGTGLGLSITYGLVQEIGGTIQVESELGKGSLFTITLPIERGERENERDTRTTG
jgi:signal transduction histidine kinase